MTSSVAELKSGFCESPPSKVGGFSTFTVSMHASANQVAATQLELANEIAHGGGTNSKHASYCVRSRTKFDWLFLV